MNDNIKKVNVENASEKRKNLLKFTLENMENIETCHISLGNSKLGKIPSFSVLPLVTCVNCDKCSKHCYACKNNFNFNNVMLAHAENTALMMKEPERVKEEINDFLNGSLVVYKYFRWNVAGEVFNDTYLQVIIDVAKNNPITQFLVFTKNYVLINKYLDNNELPKNLNIVFSMWDNIIDNKHNLPIAAVKENNESILPENATRCSGDCSNCLECWKIKKGEAKYFDLH